MPAEKRVFYSSVYGSSQAYAEEIAKQLGREAVDITDVELSSEGLVEEAPLIFVGPVYGVKLLGAENAARVARKLDKALISQGSAKHVAFVSVGLTDPEKAAKKDSSAKFVGDEKDRVARVYVPGRIHYPKLKLAHRTAIKAMLLYYSSKPGVTAFERELVASEAIGFDKVDVSLAAPVIKWAETR